MTNPQRRRAALPSPHLAPPVPTPFRTDSERACVGEDPDMFFDEDREDAALAVCAGCPARAECLAYALDSEEFGVWGGTTPGQRDALRGGSIAGTPEDRQLVWLINERVNRGDLMPDIAEAVGVNQRTLYRWLAEGREEAA